MMKKNIILVIVAVAASSCKKSPSSIEDTTVKDFSEESAIVVRSEEKEPLTKTNDSSVKVFGINKIYPYIEPSREHLWSPGYTQYRKEINQEMLNWKQSEQALYAKLLTAYGDFKNYASSAKSYYQKLTKDAQEEFSYTERKKAEKELEEVIKIKTEAMMLMTNKVSDLEIEGKSNTEALTKLESLNENIQMLKNRIVDFSSYLNRKQEEKKESIDKLRLNRIGFNSEVDELRAEIGELYISWNKKRKEIASNYKAEIRPDNNIEVNCLYLTEDKNTLYLEVYNAGDKLFNVREMDLIVKVKNSVHTIKVDEKAFISSSQKELKLGDIKSYSSMVLKIRFSGASTIVQRLSHDHGHSYSHAKLTYDTIFGEELLVKGSAHVALSEDDLVFGEIVTDQGLVQLPSNQVYTRTKKNHNLLIEEYTLWHEVLAEVKKASQKSIMLDPGKVAEYTDRLHGLEDDYQDRLHEYKFKKQELRDSKSTTSRNSKSSRESYEIDRKFKDWERKQVSEINRIKRRLGLRSDNYFLALALEKLSVERRERIDKIRQQRVSTHSGQAIVLDTTFDSSKGLAFRLSNLSSEDVKLSRFVIEELDDEGVVIRRYVNRSYRKQDIASGDCVYFRLQATEGNRKDNQLYSGIFSDVFGVSEMLPISSNQSRYRLIVSQFEVAEY